MWVMGLWTVLLGELLIVSSACGNPVYPDRGPGMIPGIAACRFAAERIELIVSDTVMTVEGTYTFLRRLGSQKVVEALRFPFLDDSTMGAPHLKFAAVLYSGKEERPLEVLQGKNEWTWFIDMREAESCQVRLRYSQTLRAKRAGYLLTSCRTWPDPIESAEFLVRLTGHMGVPSFSIPLKKTVNPAGETTYAGKFVKWRPAKDLVLDWGAKPHN